MHIKMLKATDICSDLRKDQDGSPHSTEAETPGGRGAYLNEPGRTLNIGTTDLLC